MSHVPARAEFDAMLLQASSEILLLIDGVSLVILAANPAASRLLGYTEAELVGQTVGEFECALSDMFFWDEIGSRDDVVDVESALRCADGSVLAVSKTACKVSAAPLRYALRAAPASKQNRVESELATMGSRLRATLEATADGILLVDHQGAIVNMNQRFSTMWALPQALLRDRDDAGVMRHLQSQLIGGDEAQTQPIGEGMAFEVLQLKDGRVMECSLQSAVAGEEIIGRVYSFRDVTERHRIELELMLANDQAKRASAAKGDFLAMMSHEIRTPMNGVLGIAELLAATDLNSQQAEQVRVIRSSGETLLAILNDVLDYSKIEAGKLQLERTGFALATLLDEVAALFRVGLYEGGPSFTCWIDPAVPSTLVGDPVRLRQILFNLVGNAFKFTESGSVEVRVELIEDSQSGGGTPQLPKLVWLRFAVRDTGIGLTPEQSARLFRSFEQADNSVTRKYGGTGLGLAICKRLTEMMEGQIGVDSAVGVGSEFWFTARLALPLAAPTQATAEVSVPAENALPLTPTTRVLLVEDHIVNRMVMCGMLSRLGGAEPTVAVDGQEAVALATSRNFDVILMDTQMPVMDGLEATRRLRAAGLTIPIIGVSAGALEEERLAAIGAGVSDYVLKPVSVDTLGAALRRALGGVASDPA